MKLRDFGTEKTRDWFRQIFEWSQGGISLENFDARLVTSNVGTTETRVAHGLGRIPQVVIPVLAYPHGTTTLEFTKESTNDTLYLKAATAGKRVLLVF